MRRSEYFGAALAGLLVVAAISVAAGSGRKPAKEQQTAVSLRHVSTSEAMDILRKFPELIPDFLAKRKDDAEYMAGTFGFVEVTIAPLARIFPTARFYRGHDFTTATNPYLMAIEGDKRYTMPHSFNGLLLDNGLKVSDKNIVELAQALVIATTRGEQSEITFMGASTTKLKADLTTDDAAVLKVRMGGQTEEWRFSVLRNQFDAIFRFGEKGLITNYLILHAVPSAPGRGQLDLPTPTLAIETRPVGNAYVEHEDTLPHYYLIVEQNQHPSAGHTVVFSIDSFPPGSTNVYVRVRDEIRGIDKCVRRVNMSNGSGRDTWDSAPACMTGICVVTAGYADTTKPESTYQAATDRRELTLEGMLATLLPSTQDTMWLFYCDQFFNQPQEERADTFVYRVDSAMRESWSKQVDTWQLGAPPSANGIHWVYVNDNRHWYHGPEGAWAGPGSVRQIGLRSNLWYHDSIDSAYSTEAIRVKVAVAHEFYHGIQWGLSQDKWTDSTWRWFLEGQARFLPSAQYQTEEFLDKKHIFPDAANQYLTQHLNTSLVTLSTDATLRGYPCCLFWRFMYEHFLGDTSFPQPKTALQFVRDCYAETVGTSNSIGRGKAAIDRAIARSGVADSGYADFLQTLDQFAVACYLNDDTSFRRWKPNPPGVYRRPQFTYGTDTAFRVGPNETDSILFIDSIPHSFGIDLMQVALDTNVDTVRVTLTRPTSGTLSARLAKVYPNTSIVRYRVEPPIESSPGSSTTWHHDTFPTAGTERICLVTTQQDTLDNSGCVDTACFWVKRDVGVSKLIPATDTLIAGAIFTPRAVVVNRGWMKESLYARYKIETDTVWSDSQPVTVSPGDTDTVVFRQWTAVEGACSTCCWVYLQHDSTRDDDTLHGFLDVLPERDDLWRLDFDSTWDQNMGQPCSDSGMQPGGGGRIRHQWICCWHENHGDTWPWWCNSTDYACLSWQENSRWTWDTMISPRINLAGDSNCQLLQTTFYTLDSRGTKKVRVSGDDGATWDDVWDGAWNGGQPPDTINISQYADNQRNVRIAWVYDGLVQKDSAWCVDDVEIRGAPIRSCDVAVNGIAYPCGAITGGTPITPRAYVVNHGKQSESLWVYMHIDTNWAATYVRLAPHADTLVAFQSVGLLPGNHTATCFVMLSPHLDDCPANDTATMSFSVVADTWMPKFPVYKGEGMRTGAAIVGVDSEKLFCAPGDGSPGNGAAFAKYLVAEDLWKARHTIPLSFVAGSALAYPGAGDTIYAIRGNGSCAFYRYSISLDQWTPLRSTPDTLGSGAGLACLGSDSVFALIGHRKRFYCYDVAESTWYRRHDTPDNIDEGGRLVSVGGYLYAFQGGHDNGFYQYIPGVDAWDTLASTPVPVKTGAAMACDPVTGLIYAFFGGHQNDNCTAFYVYHSSTNQWLPRHPTPKATRSGGCLTYSNHSFYGGVGMGGNHSFWRYSPPYGGGFLKAEGPQGWTGPAEASLPAESYVCGDRLDPGELLTYDPSDKQTPQYSADGRWIAYTACDTASVIAGLYRIPVDGGPLDTLGSYGVTYEDPRWSHSHSWLVAAAGDGIYKADSGVAPVRLAAGIAAGPCVTPDDSWVLYQAFDTAEHLHQVRRVRPDGTGDTCLTPGTDEYLEPQPISDSQFACARLKNEVYQLAKLTGGRETWLTSDYAENTGIDVSPNGQWLCYQKLDESGFWQVYKMRVDGTQESRVTDGVCNCETPVFSPSGQYIAYTKWPVDSTGASDYSQVCYKDTNSATPEVALNAANAERANPCWSPDCQYIIYELTTESGTLALEPRHKKQLKQIGRARTHIKHHGDGVEGLSIIPRTFALYQNRPNPFGRNTTIRYALPVPALTELSIYDVTGRSVTRLVQSEQKPGYYSVAWNGKDMRGRSVAAGTYFYVLKSNCKIAQKRMLLVR